MTHSLGCFYCMGHCEMLLEVAGLDRPAIDARVGALAGDDWSAFPPAERLAFAFARKLTEAPHNLGPADAAGLVAAFGPDRAIDIIWWASRCQFMTKVSDAFQIPLESTNVFTHHRPPDPAATSVPPPPTGAEPP